MLNHVAPRHMPGSRLAGCGSYIFTPPPVYFTDKDRDEIRKYPEQCSQELIDALDQKLFCLVPYLQGHLAVGQTYILNHGINGMISRIEKKRQEPDLNQNQKDFLDAAALEWKAALRFAERHKEMYMQMAEQESNEELKKEYLKIAKCIEKVPANPAETYVEALQSMWFMYRCVHADDSSGHTFGRLDQILYPYYKHDIEMGIITKEEAEEYFYDFWLKFCAGHQIFERDGERFELTGNDAEFASKSYHNGLFWPVSLHCITERHVDDGYPLEVAGLDAEGNDAVNELSWLVLKALDELDTVSVKPVVKYTSKTNPEFLKECYRIIASGKALPAIAFDQNMQDAMRMEPESHYTEEDLRDVSNIGCIELAIPGKSYTDAMNCFMNLPKIFLIALHNGVIDGKRIGLQLEEPDTFEKLKENYYKQLEYFIKLYADGQNQATPFYNYYYCRPLTSTLMEDCVERAQLIDDGGAKYWTKSMECCGIADVADSLMALKKVVYDDKQMTLVKFREILNKNFDGEEVFRDYLMNRIPKYGNGIEEVDELAKFVVDSFCSLVYQQRTFNGNIFRPGLYSFYGSIVNCGEVTGALPSGRRDKEIFALNISPEHGVMKNGITAVLQSITHFDQRQSSNACPVDVQLSPNTPEEVLDYIVKYLDENNALLLQAGVINHDALKDAQKHPEKYQDLLVRVSGFSARFVVLDKSVQDEIIKRTCWS